MTLHESEIRAAAGAAASMGELAAGQVAQFVLGCRRESGGFRGRSEKVDLYYTVFATNCLRALGVDWPSEPCKAYVEGFGAGERLDPIHRACLPRCWANLSMRPPAESKRAMLDGIEAFRTPDGGYSQEPRAEHGTAYGCYLALGAYENAGADLPEPYRMIECLQSLRAKDGGYANEPGRPISTTPATAAVVVLLGHLGADVSEEAVAWLMRQRADKGGFLAMPAAPIPDLLSTATALHALAMCGADLHPVAERTRDYLESLWDLSGAFRGHWMDTILDCEYTFYGLLATGRLSGIAD